LRAEPVQGTGGELTAPTLEATLSSMIDLTALDSARSLFDALDAGVIVLDGDLQPVWTNRAYRENIESRLTMCQKHCFTGLSSGDTRCEDCMPPQVQRTGRTLETVRSIRDESGRAYSFRVVITPIRDGSGSVAVILVPLADPTQTGGHVWRERFLLSAIRNGNDAVFAVDRQNTVRFWNRGAESIFGWSIEEAVGRSVHQLFGEVDPEALEVFTPADPHATIAKREIELVARTGTPVWVELSRTPLLDGSGRPNGFSFVLRDVTERRRAAEKMAFTERMSAVGNMAAALAHEIGTPLGVISNNAEYLLLDLDDDDPRREDVEVVLHEAERIGGLVRDLLEFARPEKPEMEELRFEHVLERIERLVRHTARKQKTELVFTLTEDLPTIHGDANQLEQVVLNLTMNALQALKEGGRVELQLGPHEGGVLLRVVDDGPGIPPEGLERIFHPFYTTKPNGTGLGLAVCKRIVEDHRGHLTAGRAETGGAAFLVWLPAHVSPS
jgi:PAS domain S-box-containing protein